MPIFRLVSSDLFIPTKECSQKSEQNLLYGLSFQVNVLLQLGCSHTLILENISSCLSCSLCFLPYSISSTILPNFALKSSRPLPFLNGGRFRFFQNYLILSEFSIACLTQFESKFKYCSMFRLIFYLYFIVVTLITTIS